MSRKEKPLWLSCFNNEQVMDALEVWYPKKGRDRRYHRLNTTPSYSFSHTLWSSRTGVLNRDPQSTDWHGALPDVSVNYCTLLQAQDVRPSCHHSPYAPCPEGLMSGRYYVTLLIVCRAVDRQ